MPLHDTTGRAAAAMVSMILFVVVVLVIFILHGTRGKRYDTMTYVLCPLPDFVHRNPFGT